MTERIYELQGGRYRLRVEPTDGTSWWERAKCLGADTEMFFHEKRKHEALQFCDRCPVRNECLEDALNTEAKNPRDRIFGLFGGASPEDRDRITGRRKRAR